MEEIDDKMRKLCRAWVRDPLPTNKIEYREASVKLNKIESDLKWYYMCYDRWFGLKEGAMHGITEEAIHNPLNKWYVGLHKWRTAFRRCFMNREDKTKRTMDMFIEHFKPTDERGMWIKRSRLYEYYQEWMADAPKNLTTNIKLRNKLCEICGHDPKKMPKIRGTYVFKCTTDFKDLE